MERNLINEQGYNNLVVSKILRYVKDFDEKNNYNYTLTFESALKIYSLLFYSNKLNKLDIAYEVNEEIIENKWIDKALFYTDEEEAKEIVIKYYSEMLDIDGYEDFDIDNLQDAYKKRMINADIEMQMSFPFDTYASFRVFHWKKYYVITPMEREILCLTEDYHAFKVKNIIKKFLPESEEEINSMVKQLYSLAKLDMLTELLKYFIKNKDVNDLVKEAAYRRLIELSYIYSCRVNIYPCVETRVNYNEVVEYIYEYIEKYNASDEYLKVINLLRFNIAYEHGDLNLVKKLGEHLIDDLGKMYKNNKDSLIFTQYYIGINNTNENKILMDYYNNLYYRVVYNLFDAYVRTYDYEKAYEFIKENYLKYNTILHIVDDKEKYYKYLENDFIDDLVLNKYDLFTASEEEKNNAIDEWKNNISNYEENPYKSGYKYIYLMSRFMQNIIITFLKNKKYEDVKYLIKFYNKYFLKNDEYLNFKNDLEREIRENQDLIKRLEDNKNEIQLLRERNIEINSIRELIIKSHDEIKGQIGDVLANTEKTNQGIRDIKEDIERIKNTVIEIDREVVGLRKTEEELNGLSKEDLEDYYNKFSKDILNIIDSKSSSINKDFNYEKGVEDLKASFEEENWNKLDEDSKRFLVTSRIIYKNMTELDKDTIEKLDFSPACIALTKALERELYVKIYVPLDKYYKNNFNVNHVISAFRNKDTNFTLGTISYITGYTRDEKSKDVIPVLRANIDKRDDTFSTYYAEKDFNEFCKYAKDKLFLKGILTDGKDRDISKRTLEEYAKDFSAKVIDIKEKYRDKAAHNNGIDIMTAKECYDYLIEVQKLLVNFIANYSNRK